MSNEKVRKHSNITAVIRPESVNQFLDRQLQLLDERIRPKTFNFIFQSVLLFNHIY